MLANARARDISKRGLSFLVGCSLLLSLSSTQLLRPALPGFAYTVQAASQVNQDLVTCDALCARVRLLAVAADRSAFPAIVSTVSNVLLDRAMQAVWSFGSTDLNGWSKQRMLALLIASISGGRLPSWDDAERPGQRMQEFLGRYRQRHHKLLKAEKAVLRRANAAGRPIPSMIGETRMTWEEEIYNCTFGCTPLVAPVRLVPPGKRPREVEQVQTSIYAENLKLREANNALRALETSAVEVLQDQLKVARDHLISSVLTEHASIVALDSERQKLEEADMRQANLKAETKCMSKENRNLLEKVQLKDKENIVLGAKVARAQMECAQARQMGGKLKQKFELQLSSRDVSMSAKQTEMADALENARRTIQLKDSELKSLQAQCLRLGGHIARLSQEVTTTTSRCNKQVLRAEKKVLSLEAKLEAQRAIADHMRRLKNTMAERRRAAEARAATSGRRLERAQEAEQLLRELQTSYDGLCEEMERNNDPNSVSEDNALTRRDTRGRFQAEPASMRVLKWAQLARNVPTSAVNANIIEVLRIYAPEAIVPQPCERQLRKMRGELTIAGEALAAFKIGKALRLVSFGFDESTKFGISLLSTNIQIEPHHRPGSIMDVVPRGATVAAGTSANKLSGLIERKIFRHCRELLDKWSACHNQKYGTGSWRADGGPSLEAVGLHRLCENCLLMSDTCAAAEATKRLIAEMAMSAAKDVVGAEAWDALSDAERDLEYKVCIGDCHQHIRNIIINAIWPKEQRNT